MAYTWDNRKPTAQMLGRWQPFHDGHYALFKEIIKKTGQVCIQIRDVQGVDDNPFDFETVKKNIEERLNPEFEGQFKIMLVPNITNICYGRGVGYKIEEIVLDEETQKFLLQKLELK
jgi:phosphopantetheine adenylyltransferase